MTQHSRTRRAAIGEIGAGMAGAALAATTTPAQAQAQAERKIFVLVHGSSAGGWCYRRLADLLERRGHKVFAPTLTGLGERSHLMSGMITLDTHIADVIGKAKPMEGAAAPRLPGARGALAWYYAIN